MAKGWVWGLAAGEAGDALKRVGGGQESEQAFQHGNCTERALRNAPSTCAYCK